MPISNDNDIIRGVGFVSVYSAYLEEVICDCIKLASVLMTFRDDIYQLGLSDQAKHLRKGLMKLFQHTTDWIEKENEQEQVREILKVVEKIAKERNNVIHSAIYSEHTGLDIQRNPRSGSETQVTSAEVYDLANVIFELHSNVSSIKFSIRRLANHMNLLIDNIISGGQTGVDRAALDFAISNSIPHGGACPKGRVAEDGKLSGKYQLYEVGTNENELSINYSLRTIENIKQSDGTLIIVPVYPIPEGVSDGTNMTIKKANELNKPFLIYQFGQSEAEVIRDWLKQNKIKILNIAGPRESNFPGIYDKAYALLEALFSLSRSL